MQQSNGEMVISHVAVQPSLPMLSYSGDVSKLAETCGPPVFSVKSGPDAHTTGDH